jgi:hypothetical protein
MNGTKPWKTNNQETNSSDGNNTTDASKRFRFDYFISELILEIKNIL